MTFGADPDVRIMFIKFELESYRADADRVKGYPVFIKQDTGVNLRSVQADMVVVDHPPL